MSSIVNHHLWPRDLQLSIPTHQNRKLVFHLFKLLIKLNQAKRPQLVKIHKFNINKLVTKKNIKMTILMMRMMMSGMTLIYKMQMKKAN